MMIKERGLRHSPTLRLFGRCVSVRFLLENFDVSATEEAPRGIVDWLRVAILAITA